MIAIKFNKQRAEYLVQCLATGAPIPPPGTNGWTGNDMLALAGACFSGAMSLGPRSFWLRETPPQGEYREAEEEQFFHDLHAAIEYYGHLSMLVQHGQYDAGHEPEVMALVTQEGDVRKSLLPLAGIKAYNHGAEEK